MGKALALLGLASVLLAGCGPAAAVYGESRKVTKELLAPVMAADRPGIPADAATTCLVKGMTTGEVLKLPNSAMAKDAGQLAAFAGQVVARPGVSECLAAAERAAAG